MSKKRSVILLSCLLCGLMGCGNSADVLEEIQKTSAAAESESQSSIAEAESSEQSAETKMYIEGEAVSLEEARADAAAAEEALASGKYENLSGQVPIGVAEGDQIYNIHVKSDNKYKEYSLKEFVEAAKELFGKYHACTDENLIIEFENYQTAADLKEEIESGNSEYESTEGILYRGKEPGGEMQLFRGRTSTWINRGEIAALDEEILVHPCLNGYEGEFYDLRNGIPEVSIQMDGEEVSVADAIETFEREINEEYYFDDANPDLIYRVYAVATCQITEEVSGYMLYPGPVYKGIPLDTLYGENSGVQEIKGFPHYAPNVLSMPSAMMIHKEYLDSAMDCDRNYQVEERGEGIEKILPVSAVLEQLSEKLTGNTVFTVKSAELTYICPMPNLEGVALNPTEYDYSPAWTIGLSNPNDTMIQSYSVNAVTGEVMAYWES